MVAASLAMCLMAEPVHARTFSSSCDRFEVDGNAFGPADGTPDFVDEFTAGTLAPSWALLLGTAAEAGGALVARDPGAAIDLASTPFEISTVENAIHEIGNGEGSFRAPSARTPRGPSRRRKRLPRGAARWQRARRAGHSSTTSEAPSRHA